jgi:hypothetical protein
MLVYKKNISVLAIAIYISISIVTMASAQEKSAPIDEFLSKYSEDIDMASLDEILGKAESLVAIKPELPPKTTAAINHTDDIGAQTMSKTKDAIKTVNQDSPTDDIIGQKIPINIKEIKAEENTFAHASKSELYKATYLRNVPRGSVLIANEDQLIMPNRNFLIFQKGKVVLKPKASEDGFFTNCYLKIKENNDRVLLPRHESKGLKITFSESLSTEIEGGLKVYSHRFTLGMNDNFDYFQCITTEKLEPLTLSDVLAETGNALWIKFAPVVRAKLYD